jgi:hypothetical protein
MVLLKLFGLTASIKKTTEHGGYYEYGIYVRYAGTSGTAFDIGCLAAGKFGQPMGG